MTRAGRISRRKAAPNGSSPVCGTHLASVEDQSEPITSEAHIDATLGTQPTDCVTNSPRIAGHYFAAAVGEIGNSDTLGFAPIKLRADRGVADLGPPASAYNGSADCSAVADVHIHAPQRAALVADRDHVRNIEKLGTIGRDAISDRRRSYGMFDWVSLEANAANRNRFSHRHHSTVANRPSW
jgi:hypothetical protein